MAKYGTSMGGMEVSNRARRRYAKAARAEEARWRSLNGPVTVTRIAPDEDAETRAARDAFLAADRRECDECHHEVEADPNRLRGAPRAGQDGATMNESNYTVYRPGNPLALRSAVRRAGLILRSNPGQSWRGCLASHRPCGGVQRGEIKSAPETRCGARGGTRLGDLYPRGAAGDQAAVPELAARSVGRPDASPGLMRTVTPGNRADFAS